MSAPPVNASASGHLQLRVQAAIDELVAAGQDIGLQVAVMTRAAWWSTRSRASPISGRASQ